MREQITFIETDPTTLNDDCQLLWDALLEAKAAFKAALQAHAPQGKSLQFVEKYGKLKIAVATKAQPKAQAKTLAEVLGEQQADGLAH